MPKVIIVEPNISEEENQKNFEDVIKVLERIAQDLANNQYENQLLEEDSNEKAHR